MKKNEQVDTLEGDGNGLEMGENNPPKGDSESIGAEEVERAFPKRKYLIYIGSTELVKRMTTAEAGAMLEASRGTSAYLELDGQRFELKPDPFAGA